MKVADDGSRWRVPTDFHGSHAERKNGPAASELRCRCAWLHHGLGLWARRIQGCGAVRPRPKAGSPLIVVPTAASMRSCSKPSRYGLATVLPAERPVRRPTLTAPARARLTTVRVGTKKRSLGRTKKLTKASKRGCTPLRNYLTTDAPYKEPAGDWAGAAVPALWGFCCGGLTFYRRPRWRDNNLGAWG